MSRIDLTVLENTQKTDTWHRAIQKLDTPHTTNLKSFPLTKDSPVDTFDLLVWFSLCKVNIDQNHERYRLLHNQLYIFHIELFVL